MIFICRSWEKNTTGTTSKTSTGSWTGRSLPRNGTDPWKNNNLILEYWKETVIRNTREEWTHIFQCRTQNHVRRKMCPILVGFMSLVVCLKIVAIMRIRKILNAIILWANCSESWKSCVSMRHASKKSSWFNNPTKNVNKQRLFLQRWERAIHFWHHRYLWRKNQVKI